MSEEKKEAVQEEELDQAFTEMNIVNPEEKEVYRVDSETIRLSNIDYKLIENYRDGFDLELLENRYSDYLLKYDYIVGDMSYQKLRLRGFYDDNRKGVPIDMKISNLEDYLVEYCSFGCQYFVFERVEKKEADPESYFKKRKRRSPSKKRPSRRKQGASSSAKAKGQKRPSTDRKRSERPRQEKPAQKGRTKGFNVTKKERQSDKPQRKKAETPSKKSDQSFEIRKKND